MPQVNVDKPFEVEKVGEVKKVASPNGEYEVEVIEICQGGKL